jgi:hypothetical protein
VATSRIFFLTESRTIAFAVLGSADLTPQLTPTRNRVSSAIPLLLVIITPNAPNVDNPVTLEPLGGGRFRFVAPTGGGAVGEVVRFVEETGSIACSSWE